MYLYENRMWIKEFCEIPRFYSASVSYPHGFSTRLGGVSTETGYESLDLGAGSDDAVISENRMRFAKSFGVGTDRMFSAKQIHSSNVVSVTENDFGKNYECDGFITNRPGLLLTVKTADCVPVLLADEKNGVISAVHAGWRGTVAGILINAVDGMVGLGAERRNIKAVIGPSIHSCCYEVDEPFLEAVGKSRCADLCSEYIVSAEGGKYRADLPSMNKRILLGSGIASDAITVSGECTCCASTLLFSHRAGKGRRGLMMAGIIIPERR